MNILPLGYCRVSTDRQDLSIEVQQENIQRAAEYHQLGQAEIFFDPDTSGGQNFCEREGGKLLMARVHELAKAGVSATIIIPKVDRMGRDVIDVDTTVQMLEKLGARMVFLDINVDTRTPMGRAFMQIAAVFAQLERARIRERIQSVMDSKREKGILTGTVPYGWDAVETGNERTKQGGTVVKERRLVDNLEEQQWLRHMIQLWRLGVSYNKIAADLNGRGVKTKHGSQWQFGGVKKVLHSRTVTEWIQRNNL
jgi:DNA invertase Pin-like site-specific DNA recombinase